MMIQRILKQHYITYIVLVCSGMFAFHTINAGYKTQELQYQVSINGIEFGEFHSVQGLELSNFSSTNGMRITLQRNFVAQPSLYHWAQNQSHKRVLPRDIKLSKVDQSGQLVSTTLLKASQPFSWEIESAKGLVGGFKETIHFSVQAVEIY